MRVLVNNGDENRYRFIRQLGMLTTIPFVLLSGPVIGFFIGDYIDKRFGTAPWFMVALVILGLIASARQTIQIINRAGKDNNKNG
ncbi:MAG TPA: hypothetical protein DCR39_10845 [Nitrospiraceae bacterium]|nr:hypothetical protein [Nitrospiraceae bacterium]